MSDIYKCYISDEPDEIYDIETNLGDDFLEEIAEKFAEHLYDNHDGWEWMPENNKIFVTVIDSKNEHHRFHIHLEYMPTFSATEKEEV